MRPPHTKYTLNGTHFLALWQISNTNFAAILLSFANYLICCLILSLCFFHHSHLSFYIARLLVNNVNQDVFETFYLKRASKSSHSSKSSNDSFRDVDDTSPTHHKPYTYGTSDTKPHTKSNIPTKYQSFNDKTAITSKSPTPRRYLFGSMQRKTTKHEPEKENIYSDSSNHAKDADRYKTVTINSLRRSFRDTFLKPAKGRDHQPLWFIDVNDENANHRPHDVQSNELPRKSSSSTLRLHRQSNGIDDDAKYGKRNNATVRRNETFRIDNNDTNGENHTARRSVNRHDTFRIQRNESPVVQRERLKSPSIESIQTRAQSILERNKRNDNATKKIPIAVTAPYKAQNDNETNYDSFKSSRTNKFGTFVKHKKYNLDEVPSDEYQMNRDYSPTRYSTEYDHRPLPINKTLIDIKSTEPQSKYRNQFNVDDPFEHRNYDRQSFRSDVNDSVNRPRAHRSFASLRTKLATPNRQYRPSNPSTGYDDIDSSPKHSPKHSPIREQPTEPWKRISTRQFSNDLNTENRSFVPYRQSPYDKFDNYDDDSDTKPNNLNNRTTININYNYNTPTHKPNSTGNLLTSSSPKPPSFTSPAAVNKSTSAIKSNTPKDKPNKNRSVNFPSVECEVRLISPNYDTKPRRKESWKSKPTSDWTFNKVHL